MSVRIVCPSCRAAWSVDDALRGKRVLCHQCNKGLIVPAGKPAPRAEQHVTQRPATKVAARPRDDDDDDDFPEEPRRRGKAKQAAATGGISPAMWVAAGSAGVALIAVVVLVVVMLSGGGSTPPQQVAQNPPVKPPPRPDPENPPNPGHKPPVQQPPVEQPPIKPPPDVPGQQGGGQLSREILDRVKLATVYVRVTQQEGVNEGSGFFGVEPGIVLTNAHVVGMLNADTAPPKKIDVIFKSGESDSRTFTATVLGVDRSADLAVLRVVGDNLPAPLAVKSAADLFETQQVYIIGFPFGDSLGKNVTVSTSSVSSLRKAPTGELKEVQVNGGMNPGNSGGPVVNARGEVVGVAVAGIKGTQINFAVPGDAVHTILNGRLVGLSLRPTVRDDGQLKVPFAVAVLDPMGRLQKVALEYWAGNSGQPLGPSSAPPQPRPGDTARQRIELKVVNGVAKGELVLPALTAGQILWAQPVYTNAAGQTHWVSAGTYVPSPPVDRLAANLVLKHEAGARVVAINSKTALHLSAPGKKDKNMDVTMLTRMAESLTTFDRATGSANVRMRYLRYEVGGTTDVVSPKAKARLDRCVPHIGKINANLIVDRFGKLLKNDVDSRRAPKELQDDLEFLHGYIQDSLDQLLIPVPNRETKPGESWSAVRMLPIITGEGDSIEIAQMQITCTMEGVRVRNGRREAVLSVRGLARGRDGRPVKGAGTVEGTAYFDVAAGQFSLADITAKVDMDLGSGVRIVGALESKLERMVGKSVLGVQGQLNNQSKRGPDGKLFNVHMLKMEKGKTYSISAESYNPGRPGFFDTFLRIEDPTDGRELAKDDDGGVDLNALLIFRPERTTNFRIVATSYDQIPFGAYALVVREH